MHRIMKHFLLLLVVLATNLGVTAQERPDTLIVSRDGTGDYRTISEAIDKFFPFWKHTTIYIKKGIYKEKVVVPSWVRNIEFVGEDAEQTIITYDDHANINQMGTFRTYTVKVEGSDIRFQNLTIENNAPQLGQAVALHTEGDRLVFDGCRLLGNQDTVFTGIEGTRLLFTNCYIEGTTDFIFGPSVALFENCEIHSKKNSYITAANTPAGQPFGYVFKNCRLTAASGVEKVYLARPWRAYSATVFMQCELGGHIIPEGWHNWGNPDNEKTARYAEYKNYGPGANTNKRVAWSKQMTDDEADQYTRANIFNEDGHWWACGEPKVKTADERYDYIVAADGSGDFRTVQAAINAVPDFRKGIRTTILVKKGIYKEKITVPPNKINVSLVGEDGAILTYDEHAGKKTIFGEENSTSGSASCYIYGNDFYAENITFRNTSGPVGQAVACFVSADRVYFKGCRFLSFQDTLYTYGKNSRQYYEECYIEGTTDFIFGWSTAVFNRCAIHSKGDGYIAAPATDKGKAYGYVFHNCHLTAAADVTTVYLSRPWRPYGQAVFIHCQMEKHIHPAGWDNWGKPENEKTAYYAEYQSTGEGANAKARASFSHQLKGNIDKYQIEKVLAGTDGWNPVKNGNRPVEVKR